MKNTFFVLLFSLAFGLSYGQVKSRSTTFGLDLGGAVSIFFQDNSNLGLSNRQYREIEEYKRRYERDYNSWYRNGRHSQRELSYKRQQMIQNIRIDIENIMTLEQRNTWYSYDDRYHRGKYHKPKYKKKKHNKYYYSHKKHGHH